jgi:hypothetical protein
MDPYLRPILLASAIVLVSNFILVVPVIGLPLITYFIGGVVAVLFFTKEFKDRKQEVSTFDAVVLGIGTGVLVGAVLTLIFLLKLQDADVQKNIIDTINKSMRMHSKSEFQFMEEFSTTFYFVFAIVNISVCSLLCSFGSFASLPFVNKGKK